MVKENGVLVKTERSDIEILTKYPEKFWEGVTSIGYGAFAECNNLTSVTIPNSVTNIEWFAFLKCKNLTRVNISNGVTSIGNWAFARCNSLENIEIPNSVTTIMSGAFRDCSNLTSITIPNSVTSIGNWAFAECNNLENIEIPNSINNIVDYAFYGCEKLKYIHKLNNDKIILSAKQIKSKDVVSIIDTTKYFEAIKDFNITYLLQKGTRVDLNTLKILCNTLLQENIQLYNSFSGPNSFVSALIENNLFDYFTKQPDLKLILKSIKNAGIDSDDNKIKEYIKKLNNEISAKNKIARNKKNNIDIQ